jgi:hypothetical protein
LRFRDGREARQGPLIRAMVQRRIANDENFRTAGHTEIGGDLDPASMGRWHA